MICWLVFHWANHLHVMQAISSSFYHQEMRKIWTRVRDQEAFDKIRCVDSPCMRLRRHMSPTNPHNRPYRFVSNGSIQIIMIFKPSRHRVSILSSLWAKHHVKVPPDYQKPLFMYAYHAQRHEIHSMTFMHIGSKCMHPKSFAFA